MTCVLFFSVQVSSVAVPVALQIVEKQAQRLPNLTKIHCILFQNLILVIQPRRKGDALFDLLPKHHEPSLLLPPLK